MFPSDFLISLQSPLHPQNGNEHLSIIVQDLIRCDCEGGDISIILNHHISIFGKMRIENLQPRTFKHILSKTFFIVPAFYLFQPFGGTFEKINIWLCNVQCFVKSLFWEIFCVPGSWSGGWWWRRRVSWLGLLPRDLTSRDTRRENASISSTVTPSPAINWVGASPPMIMRKQVFENPLSPKPSLRSDVSSMRTFISSCPV